MDRELLLEIGCEELPAELAAGADQSGRRGRRRAAARASAAAGVAGRNLQHAAAPDRPHRPRPRAPDRSRRARQRAAGVGELQAGRHADAGRGRLRREARRRGVGARARRDAEGRVPRVPQAPARQGDRGRAARRAARHAARRCTFPEGDALGRDARGRQGRSAVRPPDPLDPLSSTAAASCRSRSRARRRRRPSQVQDVSHRRRHLRPPLPDDQRPRRPRHQGALVRRVPRAAARELRHPRARASGTTRSRASSTPRRSACRAASAAPCTTRPACSHEVPDLVEYPSVVAGTFALEFLELPEEVLTTTLIHHQHYFPVEGEDGKLKNAFLAVINTEPDNERTIARNAERVVTARLRDARFFWEADRKVAARVADRAARHAAVPQEARHLQGEGRADRAAGRVDRRARRSAPTPRRRRRRARPRGSRRPISRPTWCASSPSCRA